MMDWTKVGDKRYSSGVWTIQGKTWCGGAEWKIYKNDSFYSVRTTLAKAKQWIIEHSEES